MTPKYEQLVQRLRAALPQWYADGQRKLPGEQALAAQLSVSRQTLRQALAVLEQEGLIEKRRGSGSFLCPAAARQDRRIAVIATLLSDYIFPSLLKDVQACLSAQGFSVIIHATENSIRRERDILQQLLLDPPAGILVEGCKTALPNPNAELYQALRQRGLPMTFLHGSCREITDAFCVGDDNYGGGYLLAGLAVILVHRQALPAVLAEMLRQAFSPRAVAGGTAGAALRWGVARGIFSNEAGMGSAAITAASAGGSPALQGYIHMTGVFFDTMVVCTVTGLAICCSGVLGAADPATGLPAEGAALTILAFETVLGPAGRVFLAVSIALFAFSSMLGWACQGETALAYLAGRRAVPLYRCLFAAAAWAGAFLDVEEAFGLSDLCNCLMALPNLACLLLLSGAAAREMESFQPEFHRNSRRKPVNFL